MVKSGVLLRSHPEGNHPSGDASGRNGTAILYDWNTHRLDVVSGVAHCGFNVTIIYIRYVGAALLRPRIMVSHWQF